MANKLHVNALANANQNWTNLVASSPKRPMPKLESFECGRHSVEYQAYSAGCPVCEGEREVEGMRQALMEAKNKLRIATERNRQLESWWDLSMAMRDAIPLLDDDDLVFLKTTLYEWRNNKSLSMKVTHGPRKKKREPSAPNGFIVMPRKGDPFGHLCTSVGGVAIADYFEEALNTYGAIQAMTLLVRGFSQHLPGGQDES